MVFLVYFHCWYIKVKQSRLSKQKYNRLDIRINQMLLIIGIEL